MGCMGCAGGLRLWTHFDVMDNLLCQIRGTKRVRLWPPLEVRVSSQRLLQTVAKLEASAVVERKFHDL